MTRTLALFRGLDAAGNAGLWVTDGTAAGTYELTGINGAASFGIAPTDITVFNGKVLFNGYDAAGNDGLWVTDGTAAGTYELTGINGPQVMTVFNGEVLFDGIDAAAKLGLWVTDGTTAGTHELTGISGAYLGVNGLQPRDLTVFNSKVLFSGTDAAGNLGLWVTDGTAAGTYELTGISGANSLGMAPGMWLEFCAAPSLRTTDGTIKLRGQLADRWALWRGFASHRPCAC
jgi:ELWxxDGT repeat protein